MSGVSDLAKEAIRVIAESEATAKVEYADGPTGTWATLFDPADDPATGWAVLHYKAADGTYIESNSSEGTDRSGRLTVSLDLTVLAVEQYIRINEDDANVWAIISGPEGTTSRAYDLQRQEIDAFKMNKGQFS